MSSWACLPISVGGPAKGVWLKGWISKSLIVAEIAAAAEAAAVGVPV
jgi:hypothetical protein